MDIIRHKIISVIRNKSMKMLSVNIQELMVEEILNELKKEFQTDTIIDIYFGEFFNNMINHSCVLLWEV